MRAPLATGLLLALASCGGVEPRAGTTAADAVVTLPAVPGRPGAAYFTLESDTTVALVGVTSPRFQRAELHDTGMRPAARFSLSPGRPLVFEPGGRHAMLYGLDQALRPGDRIALTFTFDGAMPVTAEAMVHGPGDVPMAMH